MSMNMLNFKKGWLFRLDEDEEWRKYWFVLTNSGLTYYRVSQAEEREDPEGEIDLSCCTDIVESDVEKNYGFQVHTKESVITLSAMTSKIRRSWVEILRRNIFSDSSQDQCHRSRSEILRSKNGSLDGDQEESIRVTAPLTNQREAGEGRDREQERRLEDRTRWFQEGVMCSEGVNSRWDTIELKKGTFQTTDQHAETVACKSKDIDSKWEDFERLSCGEIKSLHLDASSTHDGEALSVRQPRESLCYGQTEGSSVTGAGGLCGPDAPCGLRLQALEQLYAERLDEVQKEHHRQMEELHKDKERLLMEEAQTTAKTIEALRKAHWEELEKANGLKGQEGLAENRKRLSESDELRLQLDGLSERYSEKCVELSRMQQTYRERNRQMGHEKDIEQLRKENQELQSRLTEEITLMRSFITGQRSQSQFMFYGNSDHSSTDMEVLLRAKENEITYLQREISCLRNEVASLMKEKRSVCERFKEVYVELSRVKGATEMELGCLREHLNLTNAALQEQWLMSNST